MAVCYNRLWKLLIDRRMTKTQLCKEAGVTTNAIAKMGRDESVQVETLVKICTALQCNIEDIMVTTFTTDKMQHDIMPDLMCNNKETFINRKI